MATCLACSGKFQCPICMPSQPFEPAASNVGTIVEPCPEKCAATILVRNKLTGQAIPEVAVALTGGSGPPKTDPTGFIHHAGLAPGLHTATLSLAGLEEQYALPQGATDTLPKTIAAGSCEFYVFELDPLTELEVTVGRSDRDGVGVKQAKVTVKGANGLDENKTSTAEDGKVLFKKLRVDSVDLTLDLLDPTKDKFHVDPAFGEQTRASAEQATRTVPIDRKKAKNESKFMVALQIHLQLMYLDPLDASRFFPKDFPVTVVFTPDNSTLDIKVLDDEGRLAFEPKKDQTHFTLKFDHDKVRALSHTEKVAKPELLVDQTDDQLRKLVSGERSLIGLPKKWSLVHAAWKTEAITVPKDGKVAIPAEGLGTKAAPGKLTLKPKWQYVRLVFHDRKFGREKHSKKQVHIPAVLLKAARKCHDTTGDPTTPIAGTHDAFGAWLLDKADNAKGTQVIPWIVVKDDTGDDLPKLDKTMLIEFAWDKGFVVSKSETSRSIETVADNDVRRKPTKTRVALYDLPKLWRSKNYLTRLVGWEGDAAKMKFFDDLSEDEVDGSTDKSKPLCFSLDDIVLVDGTDQLLKDRKKDHAVYASTPFLTEHSRIAVLHLDPDDKYKIKVFDPRAEAAYHSKTMFAKDAADKYRNVIPAPVYNTRMVVFCNGFHDVWDKRSETTDFTKKHLQGARAAKLRDTDISAHKRVDGGGDVTSGYVHRTRQVDIYYLHFGECDGTTVYSALVTHWSARVFSKSANAAPGWSSQYSLTKLSGDNADATNYRKDGMANAMIRWNGKDYYYEQKDDGKDHVIKSFYLFEAKDIETAPGTFFESGGKHVTAIGVGTDATGSSATDTDMYMRRSGYKDEGANWGSDAGTETRTTDYDGSTAAARNAFAHELGHAAVGLWDDYITQTIWGVPCYNKADPQRYPGVPFHLDLASIMSVNQTPRLRMIWGRGLWINDAAKSGGTLHKFLDGKVFRGAYEPAGKTKLKYFIEGSFYKPKDTAEYTLDNAGKCTMHLYRLGEDEFSQNALKGAPFDGIVCVEMRTCVTFIDKLDPDPGAWAATSGYSAGDCVKQSGNTYVCTSDHTASAAFATDAANWVQSGDLADLVGWETGKSYPAGQWVSAGNTALISTGTHTSGDLQDDYNNARIIIPTSSPKWTEGKRQEWVGNLDKEIRTQGEKYRFEGGSDPKKIYLRPFPQWAHKKREGDGNPANTHLNLIVKTGGPDTYFEPTGSTMKAAHDTKVNTLVRYMYGLLSDDTGTRAGQDSDSALGEAVGGISALFSHSDGNEELDYLRSWVETKAGGTVVVKKA